MINLVLDGGGAHHKNNLNNLNTSYPEGWETQTH